jgi:ribosomal protein S18 acetylase RimI-like enzyme
MLAGQIRLMISIRKACSEDIPSLIDLLKILFSIEEDFVFDERLQRLGVDLMIRDKRGCILVAEHLGSVVGMGSGQLTVSTAEGGPALLVEDVVVMEKWRDRGVGRSLMDALAKWAALRGVFRLQLLADKSNQQALDFYHGLGWTTTQLICLRKRID